MGEFGRTLRTTNGGTGREHWPRCYSAVLAGGSVQGGQVHGASDRWAAYPARDPVSPDDLGATILYALGIDPTRQAPVVQALRSQGIAVEVDDDAVVLDGRPALSVIDLGHSADLQKVQGILDALAAAWRGTRIESKPAPTAQNELIVKFPSSESAELIHRLEAVPPPGWSRRHELEERMRKMRAVKAGAYCFTSRTSSRVWGRWQSG